ncbi:MAG: hypothetical protein QME12_06885 [Nanoarchaeota archaeon]|nr:hypothetical protein [Nanoarchaeota archaeon]
MDYDRKRLGVLKLVLEDIAGNFSRTLKEPVSVSELESFEPFLSENNAPYYALTMQTKALETRRERRFLFLRRTFQRMAEKQEFIMAVSHRIEYDAERETMFLHVYSKGALSDDIKEYLREYGLEFGIEGRKYHAFK